MTQTNFSALIEKAKADLLRTEKARRRKFAQISGSDFKELFTIRINEQLRMRRKQNDFVFDEDNEDLINQIFYYLIGSSKFKGEHEKGLLVLGNLGSGKTLIMNAFCQVWNDLFRVEIKSISAKQYVKFLLSPDSFRSFTSNSLPRFDIGTIFLDDIGKESKKVNVYGTEICPIADLLAERYDNGVITFMTGNYTLESLKTQYGETVTDRMKETLNILILKGKSRRK